MKKKYKAIFFDWDGTAVSSRKASVDEIVKCMKPLLKQGVKLVIVSGTTIENIANGRIQDYFTPSQLKNLYLGLGRGAYNYAFDDQGNPFIIKDEIPNRELLIQIHQIAYEIHESLLRDYGFPTDIVFSRPNYCKIDLMVSNFRGDQLFMQENELEQLMEHLWDYKIDLDLLGLVTMAEEIGRKHGVKISATSDAKYLEVGISSKSDNVNEIYRYINADKLISPEDCTFWGDEFMGLAPGLYGSDSYMRTELTKNGDFFDVSEVKGTRPEGIVELGGGVRAFLNFLQEQNMI